jgi:hypothetical protein
VGHAGGLRRGSRSRHRRRRGHVTCRAAGNEAASDLAGSIQLTARKRPGAGDRVAWTRVCG